MAFAELTASTHPAAASAAQSFDFMAVTPLWTDRRSRHQHRSYRVCSSITCKVPFFGQTDVCQGLVHRSAPPLEKNPDRQCYTHTCSGKSTARCGPAVHLSRKLHCLPQWVRLGSLVPI